MIPINDDQRWSWESPFELLARFSNVDNAEARDKGAGMKNGDVAASNVEVDKYIAGM